jgi:hypothetical protein
MPFLPGNPGRPPGIRNKRLNPPSVWEICDKAEYHPVETLITIAKDGNNKVDVRFMAAKTLLSYLEGRKAETKTEKKTTAESVRSSKQLLEEIQALAAGDEQIETVEADRVEPENPEATQ